MTAPPAIVAGYMRKAERALDEARLLLLVEKTEGACSRAYYAMHDAAHAALLATGFESPDAIIKTHHSLIAEFGKKLVLGGQIDAKNAMLNMATGLARRGMRTSRRLLGAFPFFAAAQGLHHYVPYRCR